MEDKAGAYQKGRELITKSIEAVQKGNLSDLKSLLSEDTSEKLNEIIEGKGRKLVHFAAMFGHIHILEWIFENGGDAFILDDDQNSISSLATYNEKIEVLDFIVTRYPALLAHRNKKQMTLLHIAAEACNFKIVEYLLNKGLDVNSLSENGTPLELAIMWKKIGMAKYLIEKGADPNGSRGKYFPPCIVMATSMNNKEGVEVLLEAGADANLVGNDGISALEVACEFEFDFIDLIMNKGGRVTGRVLAAAYKNKKYKVLDTLLSITQVHKIEVNSEKNEKSEELKSLGNEEFRIKNFEKAIELYTQAIEIHQASIYYSNRSQAYILSNKLIDALEDARTSRSIDPNNVKALLREGQSLSLLGNYIEAAGCYWHALKKDNNPSIASIFLSTLDLIL